MATDPLQRRRGRLFGVILAGAKQMQLYELISGIRPDASPLTRSQAIGEVCSVEDWDGLPEGALFLVFSSKQQAESWFPSSLGAAGGAMDLNRLEVANDYGNCRAAGGD